MLYRAVGNTRVRVSEIGFGCAAGSGLMVIGSPQEQRDTVARALELGINYFDTSPDYGETVSETNLGRVLKELRVRPYITTKVEVRSDNLGDIAGHVVRSTEESLQRLGVDYVDFLQIHNGPVMAAPHLEGDSYTHLWVEDYLRPGGVLEGLQRIKESGKARFFGFITRGNDGPPARQLIDTGFFNIINVSVNLFNPSAALKPFGMRIEQDYDGILDSAADGGVGTAIYTPLAAGLLSDNAMAGGPPHRLRVPHARQRPGAVAAGVQKAKALGFLSQPNVHNLAEAAMRFILSLRGVTVVLSGFSDIRQVEEIAGCSGKGPLSEENMARVEAVWRANFGLEASPGSAG